MRWRVVFLLCLARCGGATDTIRSLDGVCGAAGDLVITELSVRGAAYVEVYNGTRTGIDLSGVSLSVAGAGAARRTTLDGRIGAGRYVATSVPALPDDGGTVVVECEARPVDTVQYARTAAAVLGLDGAAVPDATVNDDPARWCEQAGSAGGANPACTAAGCGDAEAPQPGDLIISEVLRDPVGADADKEWVELAVTATHLLALDGIEIEEVGSSTRRFTLVAPACATAAAGSLIVLSVGGSAVPRLTRGSGLFNDAATLTLKHGEVVLDAAVIDCGHEGSSCALVDGAWCEAMTPTPGEENRCEG